MPTNANHHDDRARLERIDHLIEGSEPGDDALLNLLRRHIPHPHPEFTARLEHELLDTASPMPDEQGVKIARPVIGGAKIKQAQPRTRRFSVMAAAAIAIAFIGLLAVIGQMSGGAALQTGAQASVTSSPLPTATFVPTASPVILGPIASMVPTASPFALGPMPSPYTPPMVLVVTATPPLDFATLSTSTATATATLAFSPTAPFLPTSTLVNAGSEGIIWPSVRLVPVDDNQPPLEVGSRLAIYTRVLQFASWANASPGEVNDVLVTHQAQIVNTLDYAGEYVIDLPADIQPVVSWLMTNNAYFTYEVIGWP